jgi:hypothetical protein
MSNHGAESHACVPERETVCGHALHVAAPDRNQQALRRAGMDPSGIAGLPKSDGKKNRIAVAPFRRQSGF